MKFRKYWASLLAGAILTASLYGCSIPFTNNNTSDTSSEISYIPFDNKAATTEDIIQFIIQSMENNNNECDIFVADDKLIDANEWLTRISGIHTLSVLCR